jgi:hypothetical protein
MFARSGPTIAPVRIDHQIMRRIPKTLPSSIPSGGTAVRGP